MTAQDASSTKGDRTRRLLLEIAVRRFAVDGYRRTSVSDIARDAHLSPAAVYAYFTGKEALFEAAVDLDAGALIDRVRVAIKGTPVRDREAVILAELADHVTEHPLAARVLSGLEPEVIDRVLDLPSMREFNEQIASDIAKAQAAGEVRTDVDPVMMANGFEAIVLTLLMGFLQARVATDSRLAVGALTVLDAALRPAPSLVVMSGPPKSPEHEPQDAEPVAGDGVTQEAVDAAEQELATPEDTTNEG